MHSSTHDSLFERNRIYDNGNRPTPCDQQAHGLYIQGTGHVVRDNLFYGNHNYGIQAYPYITNSVFEYNTVVQNGLTTGKSGVIIGSDDGCTVSGITFVSNIVAFNGSYGFHHYGTSLSSCDIHGN